MVSSFMVRLAVRLFFFFFQAEDGIRDLTVTGVQTCALPILIGYGMGDAIFVFSAVAAYDHLIGKRDEWHIRVTNNSWGNSFRLFDPADPIKIGRASCRERVEIAVVVVAHEDR